jgi:predicted enzyme related to lactoylglutathione lyase
MSKIVLWVSSIQKQTDFYSDLFGVARMEANGDFFEVSSGQNSVLLHLLPEEFRASEFKKREDQPIKPVFEVSNISEALTRITGHRSEIGQPATYGNFIYQDLVDVEGNVIQLQQQIN